MIEFFCTDVTVTRDDGYDVLSQHTVYILNCNCQRNSQGSMTETDKIKDLERVTIEGRPGSIMTTDHGVKVRDTDNWCVAAMGVHS